MSDLFSLLGAAARALEAQQYGLNVTGQNIANVNTHGFARRSIVFAEVPPTDPRSAGGGVDVEAVIAARAPLIAARLFQEQPAGTREGTIADRLSVIQTGLGTPGASLDASLAAFYNSHSALAQDPTSAVARQQVVAEGTLLARSFNDLSSRFDSARRDADRELRQTVEQVNALAQQIAMLNKGIASGSANADTLRDQQSVALDSLSELIDVGVIQRQDGGVDLSIGNGRALVVGNDSFALTATSALPLGFASLISQGADVPTDVTSEITGGRIGGLIHVRDVLVPAYADRLDQLAYGVATDVNNLHRGGFDLNGAPGGDFFVQPAAGAGAARLMAVTNAVAADTSLVVASSSSSAAGNNDVARAIAALQDAPMTGSPLKPVDAWGDLVYRIGADAKTAADAQAGHEQIAQQLETLRDQISGVSLDEEAAMLMKFQRAYEANARFFSAADQSLEVLMNMVRS
jgi:flagellar hook-associated protein 1 FlgK